MSSNTSGTTINTKQSKISGWLAIPAPLARLFKKFPLLTYPPNELPARSPSARDVPTLYVFISDRDALYGLPSFNPNCLKWQTFLKLAGVAFRVTSSTNHASPTGALPFLLPPSSPKPIPTSQFEEYAAENGITKILDAPSLRVEAYESLLDDRIRNAWLYALYLSRPNTALLSRLYITPVSASLVVRKTTLYNLRNAAEADILRSLGTPVVNAGTLYEGARDAFEALSVLLGDDDWFFGMVRPGLFDAKVFSYTHLLLDERLVWEDWTLTEILMEFPNLVAHRDRIFESCW
ncbi:uncharacterized protein GGS22DRAFT_134896 [Annulohypoxylon maeteangense]|uniref:uncharacterized protein n=1 Tax=Annulohypoxylon maeteangense TaxID=1927788 RepID=UPI00200778DB|nr:uncharacterized protein GGS22DRAFT_134896 [Annulohypoxylon maeteangense]KAI0885824.1 hypothetical protein GGS22DRAFT_134896 [Annulohypoxylon maeteangense]